MIKVKTHATCKDSECSTIFKKYKTTDKFCSPKCYHKNTKAIPKISKKETLRTSLYLKLRKPFMNKKENQLCPVALYFINHPDTPPKEVSFWKNNIQTNELHHKAGRIGKLLLHTPLWLAVSSTGHKFIHDNPSFAYSKNWLVKSSTV